MTNTKPDIWERIAAPLPKNEIQWRQQGRPVARDGRYIARFVAYIDAQFVRARLDSVVPGEWDLSLSDPFKELLGTDGENIDSEARVSIRARLNILGVAREGIGSGKDYKQAATDAFKRAAVLFGVGYELYAMEPLWVTVDGDGKFAKPVEDPAAVYARKGGHAAPAPVAPARVLDKAGVEKALDMAPARSNSSSAAKKMPFGKHKGTPLGDLESKDLESTIAWASSDGEKQEKFKDLIAACQDVLSSRLVGTAAAAVDAEDSGLPF